jgi:hypothetical protein
MGHLVGHLNIFLYIMTGSLVRWLNDLKVATQDALRQVCVHHNCVLHVEHMRTAYQLHNRT